MAMLELQINGTHKSLKKKCPELLVFSAFALLIPTNLPLHVINNRHQRLSWALEKKKMT